MLPKCANMCHLCESTNDDDDDFPKLRLRSLDMVTLRTLIESFDPMLLPLCKSLGELKSDSAKAAHTKPPKTKLIASNLHILPAYKTIAMLLRSSGWCQENISWITNFESIKTVIRREEENRWNAFLCVLPSCSREDGGRQPERLVEHRQKLHSSTAVAINIAPKTYRNMKPTKRETYEKTATRKSIKFNLVRVAFCSRRRIIVSQPRCFRRLSLALTIWIRK